MYLTEYDATVKVYNDAVDKINAGTDIPLPPEPVKPVPPLAIKVPDILASPRSSSDFSREAFQKSAVNKYLELPAALALKQ